MNNEEQEKDMSDLDYIDENIMDPVLLSEYDHKSFLVITKLNKKLVQPQDILCKELSLSFIDNELQWIYSLKADCIDEWRSMGFDNIALMRLTRLVARLNLRRSVKGLERIAQGSVPNVEMSIGEPTSYTTLTEEEESKEQKKNIISRMLRR